MNEYRTLAERMSNAIRKLAQEPETLDNFENYLANCFPAWMELFVTSPEGLVKEFEQFSEII